VYSSTLQVDVYEYGRTLNLDLNLVPYEYLGTSRYSRIRILEYFEYSTWANLVQEHVRFAKLPALKTFEKNYTNSVSW
jgi:hypothetical protein